MRACINVCCKNWSHLSVTVIPFLCCTEGKDENGDSQKHNWTHCHAENTGITDMEDIAACLWMDSVILYVCEHVCVSVFIIWACKDTAGNKVNPIFTVSSG